MDQLVVKKKLNRDILLFILHFLIIKLEMQYCFVQTTECWFSWCWMIKNSLFYDINLHKLTVDLLVKTSWH